jgi:hypothetical protein
MATMSSDVGDEPRAQNEHRQIIVMGNTGRRTEQVKVRPRVSIDVLRIVNDEHHRLRLIVECFKHGIRCISNKFANDFFEHFSLQYASEFVHVDS